MSGPTTWTWGGLDQDELAKLAPSDDPMDQLRVAAMLSEHADRIAVEAERYFEANAVEFGLIYGSDAVSWARLAGRAQGRAYRALLDA